MKPRLVRVNVDIERFELASPFRISRGTKTHAEVVTVRLVDEDGNTAAAECVPYARYGESIEGVAEALRAAVPAETSLDELTLAKDRLRGASRNALETAIYALTHRDRSEGALHDFDPLAHAGTLVIDTPERMAEAATAFRFAVLKMKLQGDGLDLDRLRRVSAARPDLPLWLDANEGSTEASFAGLEHELAETEMPSASRVVLIEQPFRAGEEPRDMLVSCAIPICADESFHTGSDVAAMQLAGYRAVNVKLDKAGGLPSALEAARRAHEAGLVIVVGCMVSTSLSIAPAWTLVKQLRAEGIGVPFVDLDGATFLKADRSLEATGWD